MIGRGLFDRLRSGLTHVGGEPRARAGDFDSRVVEPAIGYAAWAPSYGGEPNAFQRLEDELMERVMPRCISGVGLDVGAGTGRLARRMLLRGAALAIASDLTHEMLLEAGSADPPLGRVRADVVALPFIATSFDAVAAGLVLDHVRDLPRALGELGRVLRPGGLLLVSDFHPAAYERGWQRTFDGREPEGVADRAGVESRTEASTPQKRTLSRSSSGRNQVMAIRGYAHRRSMYERLLAEGGWVLEAWEESAYRGVPVVFALRARLAAIGPRGWRAGR